MIHFLSFLWNRFVKLELHRSYQHVLKSMIMHCEYDFKILASFLFNTLQHLLVFQKKNDFPLYTEAIKFFNHPESMVRIAVRTLTLNVYKGVFKTDCQSLIYSTMFIFMHLFIFILCNSNKNNNKNNICQ